MSTGNGFDFDKSNVDSGTGAFFGASPTSSSTPPDLLTLLAQQQHVLTSIAQTLASQNTTIASQSAAPAPLTSVKNLPLPKLVAPESLSIPQFHDWKQRWTDYVAAHQLDLHPIGTQHGILRSALDPEWTILWNTGRIKISPTTQLENIVQILEHYLRRRRNPLLDRQLFLRRDQMEGESIDRYFAALKTMDIACDHEHGFTCGTCNVMVETSCPSCKQLCNMTTCLQDVRIRDRLICGLKDKEMQKKVLAEQYGTTLTLERVLSMCIAIESSKSAGESLGSEITPEAFAAQKGTQEAFAAQNGTQEAFAAQKSSYKKSQSNYQQGRPPPRTPNPHNRTPELCYYCGRSYHARERCPARNEMCNVCGIRGHFAKVCFRSAKPAGNAETPEPGVNQKKSATHISTCNAALSPRLSISTEINGTSYDVNWLPDTGAEVNAISLSEVKRIGAEAAITPDKQDVFAANGQSLGPVGSLQASLKLNGFKHTCIVRVYQHVTTPLLSKDGCVALGLIDKNWPNSAVSSNSKAMNTITSGSRILVTPQTISSIPKLEDLKRQLISEVPLAFDDTVLRPMEGPAMKIELVKGATPCRKYKAHSIPYHWRESVKEQLESMVKKDIIEPVPVGEAVDWCHPMVVVPKKGSSEPRITVDLTSLNPFVKRPAYPVKVPREAVARIPPGNKYFTTLDARHGYWQIPLDDSSKKLTSFITPWGCYRYRRNVMGLISAGDEHNRRGDEAIQGISNVEKIVEDIIIYDSDLPTHIQRVREVLRRCNEHGITLNEKKFKFAQPSVDWCGYRISEHGYSPAPHLTEALTKFPVPTNRTDVRSFCGLVQQFEAFSSKITELSAPIRSLLSPKAEFLWEGVHQQAFEALIQELSSPRVLTHFQPGAPLRLETDAAQSKGLGYALWQQNRCGSWKLLQAGSRFVTQAESRYSASEIELLAVVWATRKCRLFLLGHPFELVVDHRPLIPIINSKTLDEIESPRLLRLKEKLSSFRPQAVWRAGSKHTVVDVFSRYPTSDPEDEDTVDDMDLSVPIAAALHDYDDGTPIIEDKILLSVHDATDLDSECSRLKSIIKSGFPREKLELDEDLHQYWQFREGLSTEEGLILYGSRILIPKALRSTILTTLHAAHQGQVRTLRRARQAVFWPGLTNDIQNVVRNCTECSTRLPSQQKEPWMSDSPPTRPFESVSADLFSHAGYEYLVMTDRYSGWINVARCGHSANTGNVIHLLKHWMTDLGIPQKLTSDNGPQFASQEFANWASRWGIIHTTSSPHYPQSNGLAESGVKAAKYLVAKAAPNGNLDCEEFQLGLLELRNTPRSDGRSPAELIFGTPIRSRLPLHRSRFAKQWKDFAAEADARASKLQEKAKARYNASAKPMTFLQHGGVVRVQDPQTRRWNAIGEVVDMNPRGRSYTIKTESGRVLRRNRRFLRPAPPPDIKVQDTTTTPPQPTELRRSTRNRTSPRSYADAVRFDPRSNLEGGHVPSRLMQPRLYGAHTEVNGHGWMKHGREPRGSREDHQARE